MAHGTWILEHSAQVKGRNIGNESLAHHATFRATVLNARRAGPVLFGKFNCVYYIVCKF